jgi:hypothetical protein
MHTSDKPRLMQPSAADKFKPRIVDLFTRKTYHPFRPIFTYHHFSNSTIQLLKVRSFSETEGNLC